MLAFAWAAYPFTQYASNSNTNDALMPCFLIWGFWLVSSPGRARRASRRSRAGRSSRRSSSRRSGSRIPAGGRRGGSSSGSLVATLAAFSIVLLEPSPLHELRVFWDRTVRWQVGRDAPWSLWDWGQYHARGLPDLHIVQRVLQALLVAGAVVVAFVPRRKSPLQLAALTAALLAGFELVLTYWLYTYIPWFFGFAAIAAARAGGRRAREPVAGARASTRSSSIAARPAVVCAVDDDALDPHAALGRLEPDRQARAHPRDRELGLHADHRVVRPGHARRRVIAAVPPRQDARVVRLHVRVRADHGGDAPVEPASPSRPSRSSPRRGSRATTTGACARASSTSSSTISHGDTGVSRKSEPSRLSTATLTPLRASTTARPRPGRPRAGVRRPDHALARGEIVADAVAAVGVVAERDDVGAGGEQLVGELRR